MKKHIILIVCIFMILISGCSFLKKDFSQEESLLSEMRDIDVLHNDMNKKSINNVDRGRISDLMNQFQENENFQKQNPAILLELEKELQKSLADNHYKLQQLSQFQQKIKTLQKRIPTIKKDFQNDASDTIQALQKQYNAEMQLTAYYAAKEGEFIPYLQAKRLGKTPLSLPYERPPINPNALNIFQQIIDRKLKAFDQHLDEAKGLS